MPDPVVRQNPDPFPIPVAVIGGIFVAVIGAAAGYSTGLVIRGNREAGFWILWVSAVIGAVLGALVGVGIVALIHRKHKSD